MKKLILSLVFVFAAGTMINANINSSIQKTNDNVADFDCQALAMQFGTNHGQGDETLEWFYTDMFYNIMC